MKRVCSRGVLYPAAYTRFLLSFSGISNATAATKDSKAAPCKFTKPHH